MDQGARADLHYKLGERVEAGDCIYTIHAAFPADFEFARESAGQDSGYSIGDHYVDERP